MTEHTTALVLGEARWPSGAPGWAQAVAAHGPEQAAALARGRFAVGLRLPDGRIFLAVDRFATHTLCWRAQGDQLRFAERADELGAGEIDPQALFDYLYAHAIPSPRTVFRGVSRLPPGHYGLFDRGRLTVAPYWTPRFSEPAKPDFPALRAEFRGLLRAAVAAQLDGSPPACFLSGGTDSSTVAGHLQQITGHASTYSIGFDAQGYDEMAFARIAARHFGTDHHEYYVTPDDLVRNIPEVAASFDQPFGNSSALPAYCCARQARQDGVTRLVAGDGGDELFGGNSRYAMQRIYGWYGEAPSWLRAGLLDPVFGGAALANVPLLKKGASYVRDARVPLPDRLQAYNLLRRLGWGEVLRADFLAAVSTESPLEQQREVWRWALARHEIDRNLAFDWRYTLAESDLPKVNGATGLAGVQVAYPFLDDDLLEFSMRLPPQYKLRGLKLRWFFKEALRDFLPAEIITKQKKGFGLPFGVWVNRHEGLKALAQESLRGIGERGLVRQGFLDQLVHRHLPEHPGYYGEMVWVLMMLEQWLRHHAPDYRFGH